MKFVSKDQSLFVQKPEGTAVNYYLFDEYEIHYNEQSLGTTQLWHHHEKIWETIYMIKGELLAKWRDGDQEQTQLLHSGDLVEVGNIPHTFANNTDQVAQFVVIKQVLSGKNQKELLKNDKVLD